MLIMSFGSPGIRIVTWFACRKPDGAPTRVRIDVFFWPFRGEGSTAYDPKRVHPDDHEKLEQFAEAELACVLDDATSGRFKYQNREWQ